MDAATKLCPLCAETIKAEAKLCRFCGAKFEVSMKGYCPTCHAEVTPDENDRCPVCRGEVMDRHSASTSVSAPPAAPAPGPQAVNAAGLDQAVREQLQQGKKIEAIRIYRMATGTGLVEAKKAVEDFEAGQPLWIPPAPPEAPAPSMPAAAYAASPAGAWAVNSPAGKPRMSFWNLYLWTNGRIGRLTFFLKGILPLIGFLIVTSAIIGFIAGLTGTTESSDSMSAIILVEVAIFYWIWLMLVVKRFHDLGRSGWNIFLWLVPFVGQFIFIWNLVELFFFKGTEGPNRHGQYTD